MVDYGFCQSELAWGDQFTDEANIRRTLQGIRDVGGSRIRFNAAWDLIDKTGQPYNWVELDRAVNLCAEYAVSPLMNMSIGYGRGGDGSPAAYGNWCKAAAQRYGPSGTNRVNRFELWNEENWSQFFTPTTPAAYTEFLKAGYSGIKALHSGSTVMTGGTYPTVSWSGPAFAPFPPYFAWVTTVQPDQWIQGIYDAGGAGYFDAVGMHWYSGLGDISGTVQMPAEGQWEWEMIETVRAIMVAQGDSTKQIWITEMGFTIPSDKITATTARDYLKAEFDLMASKTYFGPPFIYSFRDTSRTDPGGHFGVVDFDYTPKSPYYEYVDTLNPPATDVTPPSAPTGLTASDVTSTTALLRWNLNAPAEGATNYRVYSSTGSKVADTPETSVTLTGLPAATLQSFYVTAVDAAGNESTASALVQVTTNAPQGQQEFYQYNFVGAPTTPSQWTQTGLGFTVASNFALHNNPTLNGRYWTVAPYFLNQATSDHASRIQIPATLQWDRAAMPCVRMSADGSQWVGAPLFKGTSDALQIITYVSGGFKVRNAFSVTGLVGELELKARGNIYTVDVINNGERITLLSWTDSANTFSGRTNTLSGIGWRHRRVGGTNYSAPGITGIWRGTDVVPVQGTGAGDSMNLGLVNESDWAEVIATNIWEASI